MMANNIFDIDLHCNDPWKSMQQIDPKYFKTNQPFMKRVNTDLERFGKEPRYNYIQHIYKGYYQQLAPK